jgi:hypothetical protein
MDAQLVAMDAQLVAIDAQLAAHQVTRAIIEVFAFGATIDNSRSSSASVANSSGCESTNDLNTNAYVEKNEKLDFEALLQDKKFDCWPSEQAARSFAEVLRAKLTKDHLGSSFLSKNWTENPRTLSAIFEHIKTNTAAGTLEREFEKDHTHHFCLPLFQSVVAVARAKGDWPQLPAEYTLYTEKLVNDRRAQVTSIARDANWTAAFETDIGGKPDGLLFARTVTTRNNKSARDAVVAIEPSARSTRRACSTLRLASWRAIAMLRAADTWCWRSTRQ